MVRIVFCFSIGIEKDGYVNYSNISLVIWLLDIGFILWVLEWQLLSIVEVKKKIVIKIFMGYNQLF